MARLRLAVRHRPFSYQGRDGDVGSGSFLALEFVEHAGIAVERWLVIPGWAGIVVFSPLPIWAMFKAMKRSTAAKSV
jgi:hypothetical protein